jgi:hypothetical protein
VRELALRGESSHGSTRDPDSSFSVAKTRLALPEPLLRPSKAQWHSLPGVPEPSAADDRVCLDLDKPAGIEKPLDDDEPRGRSDSAEDLAVHLRDSVTVSCIHEEHTRSHHVTKRRAGLAKRLADDLQAPSRLYTYLGIYVAVRPDRGSCGNEDEMPVAHSPAEADARLKRRA